MERKHEPQRRLGLCFWRMAPVTAVIMNGAVGPSVIEQRLGAARRAALSDLLHLLKHIEGVAAIIVAAPQQELQKISEGVGDGVALYADPLGEDFHFGRRLSSIVRQCGAQRLLYLGAACAPLIRRASLERAVAQVARARGKLAVTNNFHSADWAAFSEAAIVPQFAHRLERDNMLAWVLREEAGYEVIALPPSAESRLDIDTPFDLRVLALHGRTPPRLRGLLGGIAADLQLEPLRRAAEILRAPGSRVTLIGRVPAAAAAMLESKARCWTRVLSEERGMAANRRQVLGQVFSIVADHIERAGEKEFMAQLARVSDVVFFDTRVYLAHHHLWPPPSDRFASDTGLPELIADGRLRRLTEAALAAGVPVLLGGHNAVSGGLYALLEIAEER